MAGRGRGQDTFNVFSPLVGRGRALHMSDETIGLPHGLQLTRDSPLGSRGTPRNVPAMPTCSTPRDNNSDVTQQLRELIGELGSQIGETIASRILANQSPVTTTPLAPPCNRETESLNNSLDLSKMSVDVRSDFKEPPMFRGDDSDKYTVQEWIDVMELYLHKSSCPDTERSNTILSHLLGRAKNIVKVGLKSSSAPNTVVSSEKIYDVLKHYFSDSPVSSLPLADFYATRPKDKESPVDYWVRLNATAERAANYLQQNGGKMENINAEIAMMFIRNCNSPDLSSVFKCKPMIKWSIEEVQEAIDEYQRESQSRNPLSMLRPRTVQVASAAAAVSSEQAAEDKHTIVSSAQSVSNNTSNPPENVAASPNALERVLSMLEKVLERTSQSLHSPAVPHVSPWARVACRVCSDTSHSTCSHCMKEKQCWTPATRLSQCCSTHLTAQASATQPGKLAYSHSGGDNVSDKGQTLSIDDDVSVYEKYCENSPNTSAILFQNVMKLEKADSLFYTDVLVKDQISLRALLDSGSMACTMNEEAEQKLKSSGIVLPPSEPCSAITLVGCGGAQVQPKCIYEIEMEVYGHAVTVPTLVVPGQRDQMILGTNVIKYILSQLKKTPSYWRVLSQPESSGESEIEQFLNMLSGLHRWKGKEIPSMVGTAKLTQAITLLPKQEHLVWAKLPATTTVSEGSAILIEPPRSQAHNKNIIVGRVVASMSADRWVPVKILNPCDRPVILRRNSRVADVFPCLALEDFDINPRQSACSDVKVLNQKVDDPTADKVLPKSSLHDRLNQLGLGDLDVDSCEVSAYWKEQLVDLVCKHEEVFSKNTLDCGKAKDFSHRIHLSDDRPFRLPYRHVPPGHYHKLRQVLSEMEEREIIRKSSSEWASPLVLVWKKSGDLRICVDYRWLNARTTKDAHPLPHQADCLAALGGNAIFSAMDLTSGFYNIEMAEEDKKLTAFTTPMGLFEFNRLPQGLCNSPASFMRLMMGVFGDQNFHTLLCYLDDLLVVAPNEGKALNRLELVFNRLSAHGLKLAPKKCHLLRRSVKFLGHVVDENGIATDPDKVGAITAMTEADLMMEDGVTPSQRKIKAFLGMVMYYQRFIQNCSSIAKPLFALTAAPKGRKVNGRGQSAFKKLNPNDWKEEHCKAFENLKLALLESVVLAHPDFNRPFILSMDASLDGLGAVLSQVSEGETKARPIAFASKSLTRAQSKYPAHRLEFLALKWSVCDKFSHWLKGQTFTVWTDNNPLTYILTKPKLDACEQRWVSKLAPYNFNIQYIPGSKNVVADALSRQPFTRARVSQRLVTEPYTVLLEEAQHFKEDAVQLTFHVSAQCQVVQPASSHQELTHCSLSCDEVSAILDSHIEWDAGFKEKVGLWLSQSAHDLLPPGQSALPVLSLKELQDKQQDDPVLSRVLSYVTRGRKPSRRERTKETFKTLKTLKQWDKLKMLDGILYRVCKDPLSGKRRHQYVVPASLIELALQGVHDDAGHQGQSRTLYLARQRFFWVDMEQDIREYVKHCKRCVVSKTPEPEGRAPLESVRTSRPLELVCIDFWSAEDSRVSQTSSSSIMGQILLCIRIPGAHPFGTRRKFREPPDTRVTADFWGQEVENYELSPHG
ncbi:hypothetical protein SRHO_G00301420 [Serrasalmus rhombeus]